MKAAENIKKLTNLLLLLSGNISDFSKKPYLQHAIPWIKELLSGNASGKPVLFFPFATPDYDASSKMVKHALNRAGIEMVSAHELDYPVTFMKEKAGSIFVNGGNAYMLKRALEERGLLEHIQEAVINGMPYIGSSAGSIIACPGLSTAMSFPVVEVESFYGFGFVNFQIIPHYHDRRPEDGRMTSTLAMETGQDPEIVKSILDGIKKHYPCILERRPGIHEQIEAFHSRHSNAVLCLRDGTAVIVFGNEITLLGDRNAMLFFPGQKPVPIKPGESLHQRLAFGANSTAFSPSPLSRSGR